MPSIVLMLMISLTATVIFYLTSRDAGQRRVALQPVTIRSAKSHRR